ncbi:hypothetical protein MTO96_041021 [Rhipicephalus appendiculatus]
MDTVSAASWTPELKSADEGLSTFIRALQSVIFAALTLAPLKSCADASVYEAGHNTTPVESLATRVKNARQTSLMVNCKKMDGAEKKEKEEEYRVKGVEYYEEAGGNPQGDEWD